MDTNSKIYVSGHSGMLGSAMMQSLRAEGYTNIITRTHHQLDLTRQKDVEGFFATERPDYVFHIAAKTGGVMLNKQYPFEYLNEGILIALNVLNAAHEYGAKGVVYVSSVMVYPKEVSEPIDESLFASGCLSFYGGGYALSKTVGIKCCESINQQFGKHFVSAILPAMYGQNDRGTTVIPMLSDRFAYAVLNDKPDVVIWGSGDARREFIHAEDAANALLHLMEKGESGQYYNVGSGEEYTIRELSELLKGISGFKGQLIFDTTKPESAKRQLLNSQKIYDLGWRPKIPFHKGIREVYQEHLEMVTQYI